MIGYPNFLGPASSSFRLLGLHAFSLYNSGMQNILRNVPKILDDAGVYHGEVSQRLFMAEFPSRSAERLWRDWTRICAILFLRFRERYEV
jgi:hypothetical protein